jgi:hypothetical protein
VLVPLLLAAVVPAGCGGAPGTDTRKRDVRSIPPYEAALCLNNDGFVVEADTARTIRGSSPDGINFTVVYYRTLAAAETARDRLSPQYSAVIATTVVDFSGNPQAGPHEAAAGLTHLDLVTIRSCVERR